MTLIINVATLVLVLFALLCVAPAAVVDGGAAAARCTGDADCSYNGQCDASSGACACEAAWWGAHCERLNVQAGRHTLGYAGRNVTGGGGLSRLSSWGGAPSPMPHWMSVPPILTCSV